MDDIYTSSRDENNTVLPLVLPANLTTVRLHELFSKLGDADSHSSTCNADGAVYQTCQELITASYIYI